ncbi:recombinase family protein [Enterococcus faecalis]|uniref:recombinase family protein n=2 Tax=Enterococcus faecalis TaxID=1351 RepID=UPI003D76813D
MVEKIFSLAYQGYGSAKITKVLREEKVPTASWLNFTRYGTFAHIFEGKPESEWFRVEITHKPIIDKEVFYRVQEQIKSRRRQTKEKATPIFAGLVKCADCGWSMRFATNKANKTPYSYYACSYYGQFGNGTCSMHYIRYDVLYQAVLERL